MANKHHEEDVQTGIDNLNDSLTNLGEKAAKNSKAIVWACIAMLVLAGIGLFYIYGIRQPGIQKANDAIGQADLTLVMGNDSLALSQYKAVANDYGYDAGNRANLNAAILLYQKGDYQEAINFLKNYDPQEEVIGAAALSLEGDCYVNLKDYDNALSCFQKAAAKSDNNPNYTPFFLCKEANVYRELKNYKAEADIYRQIVENYPNYGAMVNTDFEKYLRRAEIQAGE